MKTFFLFIFLSISLIIVEDYNNIENGYNIEHSQTNIKITNGGYEAITIDLYYYHNGVWEYIGNAHLPGGTVYSFGIGGGLTSDYGYSKTGDNYITRFYSSNATIY